MGGRAARPLFVLGGGSNLVIADEGFDGLVLQVALRGVRAAVESEDTIVSAGAGELWDPLVDFTVSRGLAGIECLSGIPGTVGGTPIQNVGAYGQEVASLYRVGDGIRPPRAADRHPVRLGMRIRLSHEPIQAA